MNTEALAATYRFLCERSRAGGPDDAEVPRPFACRRIIAHGDLPAQEHESFLRRIRRGMTPSSNVPPSCCSVRSTPRQSATRMVSGLTEWRIICILQRATPGCIDECLTPTRQNSPRLTGSTFGPDAPEKIYGHRLLPLRWPSTLRLGKRAGSPHSGSERVISGVGASAA